MLRKHVSWSVLMAPANEGGGEGGGGVKPAVDPPKPTPAAASADDAATLKAELAKLQKNIADRDAADDAAKNDAKNKALKNGEHEKVIAQQNEDLAKLQKKIEELSGHAKLGKSYEERERARIDAAKKTLTAEQSKLIDDAGSIDLQARILDAITGAKPTTPTTPNPGNPGGPPAGDGTTVDFAAAWKEKGKAWEDAKKRGGEAWLQQQIYGAANAARPLQFLSKPAALPQKK